MPNDKCFIYDSKNDLIVYRDQSHLTKEGANLLLNKLNNFIKVILKKIKKMSFLELINFLEKR